jgi:hypothetical protein
VAELERNVGRKQLEVEYLEKVIETASTELGLDIKKKSGLRSSNGSASTPKNMAGR